MRLLFFLLHALDKTQRNVAKALLYIAVQGMDKDKGAQVEGASGLQLELLKDISGCFRYLEADPT